MKVFIPAYFITSGHSVQKWKGTDMGSMRDTKRIMEREIKKGSTPLSFEQMEIDTNNYQEITSVEKPTEVLQYIHRVEAYKSLAGKTVINNVYTFMRGRHWILPEQEVYLNGRRYIIRCFGEKRR